MRDSKIPRHSVRGLLCLLPVVLLLLAQLHAEAASQASQAPPDRAYLQQIWDGWGTLDAAHQTQFYAQGPHVFFDESPLKYDSWKQFETGVAKILTSIKSAKFTVNSDEQIHPAGNNWVWATATVHQDALLKDGTRDVTTLRWTVIFEKQNGRWLIVHEHVSRPTQ